LFTAEVGRQPWIVYGLMRTADAVSPLVSAGKVLASLVMFLLIYLRYSSSSSTSWTRRSGTAVGR